MRARDRWRPRLLSTRGGADPALDGLLNHFGFTDAERLAVLELSIEGQRARITTAREGSRREVSPRLLGTHLTVFFEGAEPVKPGLFDIGDDGPRVELRLERDRDRRDKDRGLVREVQTGFAEFDDVVFIEDHATEADVLRVLSKAPVRAAVLDLLDAGISTVTLTREAARIFVSDEGEVLDDDRILDALESLLVVGKAGGLRDDAPVRGGDTAIPLFAALAAAMLGYAFFVWNLWPTSPVPGVLGLLFGAVVSVAGQGTAEKICAGDGASAKRSLLLLLTWGLTASMAVAGVVVHLNGALDDGEPETRRGVVTEVFVPSTSRSSSRSGPRAVVRWGDGSSETLPASAYTRRGEHVTERRHPGALGIGWREAAVFSR